MLFYQYCWSLVPTARNSIVNASSLNNAVTTILFDDVVSTILFNHDNNIVPALLTHHVSTTCSIFGRVVHKAMHNHDWPSYLKLEVRNHSRQLRSTSATTLTIPLITRTFQDLASKLFNILPDYIRNETDFSIFRSQTKLFLKERIIVGN